MLIGTAGHIDHGKTTLVKALTGVDADRLPEEKARGITLDLGYAYAPVGGTGSGGGDEEATVLAFIDVPGHEKLVHNMLAGATGIDCALLVIAADDGPMPQTREHLELLALLGIGRGAIALSKCDVVDAARLAAARCEIAQLVEGGPFAASPVFPVSGVSGEGVAALRAHLEAGATTQRARPASGHFRLAIDRAFTLAGLGTVVTGTAHAGRVAVGDTLTVSPPGFTARVRSLHVQDRPAERGQAGDRIALALAGDFEKKDIARGMWLVDPALARAPAGPLQRFHAELAVPASQAVLKHWTAVHVHHGASDLTGRIALLDCTEVPAGGRAFAEIVLDRPTLAARGDRFVLRDAAAARSIAGGRVLDCFPPTRHKRSAARLALLAALADDDPAVALAAQLATAPAGADLVRFAANWNLAAADADALWARLGLRVVGHGAAQSGFAADGWTALGERLLAALAGEHQRAPDTQGVERERLRRMTLATLSRAAFDALLAELQAAGRLAQTRAWLHLPEHRASVSAADRDLYRSVAALLAAAPYNPPRVRDVVRASGIPEDTVRQLFRRLAPIGELYRVAHDHFFTAQAVGELAEIIAALCAEHGTARAAQLRDRIGGGRKVAIQILEFFDALGYTRRVRDEHVLREHFGEDIGKGSRSQWLPQ